MSKIMISYSRANESVARDIERDLDKGGYSVWRDTSSIPGSAEWDIAIQKAIDACEVVVAIVSITSLESRWVRRELVYADGQNKRILPLLLERVNLPPLLVTTNYIDFTGSYSTALFQLLEQLPKLLDGGESPTPEAEKRVSGMSLRDLRRVLVNTYGTDS
ncbi:MAG: toll/interleukin-1 receptor domain-containing protein [Anaerolineae bacterium]|nr:toll/interleukin-1 receptor domain-containing protein [Anaerolineae bacterium]